MAKLVPAAELSDHIGKEVGLSDWLAIDQDRINAFADVTGDHQWIHVDPEKAAATPWGSTVAHGFLTLSLLPHLLADAGIGPEGTMMALNYGTDKVRFVNPVKVDSKVRARSVLMDATERNPGQWMVKSNITIEVEGEEKPALVAETLTLFITG